MKNKKHFFRITKTRQMFQLFHQIFIMIHEFLYLSHHIFFIIKEITKTYLNNSTLEKQLKQFLTSKPVQINRIV